MTVGREDAAEEPNNAIGPVIMIAVVVTMAGVGMVGSVVRGCFAVA